MSGRNESFDAGRAAGGESGGSSFVPRSEGSPPPIGRIVSPNRPTHPQRVISPRRIDGSSPRRRVSAADDGSTEVHVSVTPPGAAKERSDLPAIGPGVALPPGEYQLTVAADGRVQLVRSPEPQEPAPEGVPKAEKMPAEKIPPTIKVPSMVPDETTPGTYKLTKADGEELVEAFMSDETIIAEVLLARPDTDVSKEFFQVAGLQGGEIGRKLAGFSRWFNRSTEAETFSIVRYDNARIKGLRWNSTIDVPNPDYVADQPTATAVPFPEMETGEHIAAIREHLLELRPAPDAPIEVRMNWASAMARVDIVGQSGTAHERPDIVRERSSTEQIVRGVFERIQSGELPNGTRLDVNTLNAALDVYYSHPTYATAFNRLAALGFISVPGQGRRPVVDSSSIELLREPLPDAGAVSEGEASASREDALRAQFPDALLGQIRENGITSDYYNQLVTQRREFEIPGDETERLARAFAETKTYSEYWRDRIAHYNATAEERGNEPVDPDQAFAAIVTNQPGAAELDAIAQQVRALGEQESWTKESVREPFGALHDQANAILKPKAEVRAYDLSDLPDPYAELGDMRDVLEANGVPADIAGYVNERGVDGNYLNYLSGVFVTLASSHTTESQKRAVLEKLPSYSEYLQRRIHFAPETSEDDQAGILDKMLSTRGAQALDTIAEEYQSYAGQEDLEDKIILAELRQSFLEATFVAHGAAREQIVRRQFEER